jgi:hypothetical protein
MLPGFWRRPLSGVSTDDFRPLIDKTMKGIFHDPAENPDARHWVPAELDEESTKQAFARLNSGASFLSLALAEGVTLLLVLGYRKTWTVKIIHPREGKEKACEVGEAVALQFVETAFRGYDVESLAESLGIEWYNPAEFNHTMYHPGRSEIRDDGALIISAGGYTREGIWDGYVTIEPSSEEYPFWMWLCAQPSWQAEDAVVVVKDPDLVQLRTEFAASLAKEPGA